MTKRLHRKTDAAKALAEENKKKKSITVKIQAGVEGRVFGSISSKGNRFRKQKKTVKHG